MTEYDFIAVETPADHVRRISLNRPEKRNAISTAMNSYSVTPRS